MDRLILKYLLLAVLCNLHVKAQPFIPGSGLDGILDRPIDARAAGLDMMGGAGAGERFSNGLRNGWDGSSAAMGHMAGGHVPPPMPINSPVNPGLGGIAGPPPFGPAGSSAGSFIPLSMTGAGMKPKPGLGKLTGKSKLREKLTGTLHAIQTALKTLDQMDSMKIPGKLQMFPKKTPIMSKKPILPKKLPMFPKRPPMFPKKPVFPKKPPPMIPQKPIRPMKPMRPIMPPKPMKPMRPIMPPKPMKPMRPIMPAKPMKPMRPIMPPKPMKPMRPIMPPKPMKPMRPIMPAKPMKPMRPIMPPKPMKLMRPIMPAKPMKPMMPIMPAKPMKPMMPIMPKKGPMPVKPFGPILSHKPKPFMDKFGKTNINPIHAHDPFMKWPGLLHKKSMKMKRKFGEHVGKNIYGGY